MKIPVSFLSVLFVGISAHAVVPYGQMENLRRQSVVTRVILDNPEDASVKSCGIKIENFAAVGGSLSLALDAAAEKWQKQHLQESDLTALKVKIKICESRGSCQIYEKYLSSVKVDETLQSTKEDLVKLLERKLESLDAASYKKALATVPEPCKVLKDLAAGRN